MYRRRRAAREKIAFSFDSFLDLIANVIGIILRLILVAWVGARAYNAGMQWREDEPEAESQPMIAAAPRAAPHPLEKEIARAEQDLQAARRRLLACLDDVEAGRAEAEAARRDVDALRSAKESMAATLRDQTSLPASDKVAASALALAGLEQRGQELIAEIKALEAAPPVKKLLGYHTPVSRVVEGEELMFECRGGRVSFIDVPAFLHEIRGTMTEAKLAEIARLGRWTDTTASVGAFRVRFTFEAQRSLLIGPGGARITLTHWMVEPIGLSRGEDRAEALRAGSQFRRLVDGLDPNLTTVTFWVYPDSFALFRALRDHLYESGIEVAGRPLPMDHPIGASIHGTRSRGQ